MRTLVALLTLALTVTGTWADVYDPPQFPTPPTAGDPPQFPRPPQTTAPGWEQVPNGYPPPPSGFKWEKYPSGQWGLVQFGVALPNVVPVNTPVVLATPQVQPRPFESRPVQDTTPATTARTAAGANTALRVTTGTGRTTTFALGAGPVGGINCAVG